MTFNADTRRLSALSTNITLVPNTHRRRQFPTATSPPLPPHLRYDLLTGTFISDTLPPNFVNQTVLVTLTLTLPDALALAWNNDLPLFDSDETIEFLDRITAAMLLINDTSYDAFDNICLNATFNLGPAGNANVTNVTNVTNATLANAFMVTNISSSGSNGTNGTNGTNGSNMSNGSGIIVRLCGFEKPSTQGPLGHKHVV